MFEDNRTRYTKKIIQDAFFELLKTNPIKKITVKSICDLAQINRSTFYRYYKDVYDLLDKIQDNLISQFNEYADRIASLEDGINYMLKEVEENNDFYIVFSSVYSTDGNFTERISEVSYERFKDGFSKRFPNHNETQLRWTFFFLIHGCMAITQEWIKNGMKEPSSEVAIHISNLFENIL